jgi:hypothetical protein
MAQTRQSSQQLIQEKLTNIVSLLQNIKSVDRMFLQDVKPPKDTTKIKLRAEMNFLREKSRLEQLRQHPKPLYGQYNISTGERRICGDSYSENKQHLQPFHIALAMLGRGENEEITQYTLLLILTNLVKMQLLRSDILTLHLYGKTSRQYIESGDLPERHIHCLIIIGHDVTTAFKKQNHGRITKKGITDLGNMYHVIDPLNGTICTADQFDFDSYDNQFEKTCGSISTVTNFYLLPPTDFCHQLMTVARSIHKQLSKPEKIHQVSMNVSLNQTPLEQDKKADQTQTSLPQLRKTIAQRLRQCQDNYNRINTHCASVAEDQMTLKEIQLHLCTNISTLEASTLKAFHNKSEQYINTLQQIYKKQLRSFADKQLLAEPIRLESKRTALPAKTTMPPEPFDITPPSAALLKKHSESCKKLNTLIATFKDNHRKYVHAFDRHYLYAKKHRPQDIQKLKAMQEEELKVTTSRELFKPTLIDTACLATASAVKKQLKEVSHRIGLIETATTQILANIESITTLHSSAKQTRQATESYPISQTTTLAKRFQNKPEEIKHQASIASQKHQQPTSAARVEPFSLFHFANIGDAIQAGYTAAPRCKL